jgi:kynureninase
MLYLYQGLAAQGAEVVRVPSADGRTIDPGRLAAAVDERTAVVAFSHVLFKTGAIVDPAPVVERARAVGAMTLLDTYQSAATLPVDLTALGVDAAAGGSVKWLCGGPGAGYLYVRPDVAKGLRPRLTGWFAHAEPFAFAAPPMRYAEGPFRFLNGTTSVPALYAARAGYGILRQVGVARVRQRSLALTGRLFRAAAERGWRVHTPAAPEARGGTVVIDLPDAARLRDRLAERDILVDARPDAGLRLGPHFYNTEEEVDRAVGALDEILERKSRRNG